MSSKIGFRGPSLATILAVLFIALKLTGNIAWSWWWVLSPIWIPWSVVLVIIIIAAAIAIVVAAKG